MNQITPVQFFPPRRPSPPPARRLEVVSPFEPNGDQPNQSPRRVYSFSVGVIRRGGTDVRKAAHTDYRAVMRVVRAISLTPCRRKIVHAGVNIASRGCWTDREVPERWMIFWRRWMPFIQVPTLVGLPSWMPCRIMRSTLFRNFPADAWLPLWLDRFCCTKACNRPL